VSHELRVHFIDQAFDITRHRLRVQPALRALRHNARDGFISTLRMPRMRWYTEWDARISLYVP